MQDDVINLLAKINRRKLKNNTQKVLFTLLTAKNEWISRSSIRIPSAGSRLRDLRKPQFGGFKVECASATKLGKRTRIKAAQTTTGVSIATEKKRQTYYRVNPSSVTLNKVAKVFEGVINTSNQ
jgi:hypothetical protein